MQLHVEFVSARDLEAGDLSRMAGTLTQWCANTAGLLEALQGHLRTANEAKAQVRSREEDIATQAAAVKQSVKASDGSMEGMEGYASTEYLEEHVRAKR